MFDIQRFSALPAFGLITAADKAKIDSILTREELELICGKRAMDITTYCAGVMSKYGVNIKTQANSYNEIGDNWTVEFFVRLNGELTTYPDSPAAHFILIDSNNRGLALGLSKSGTVDGHPCESFFIGDVTDTSNATYFDSMEVTIADGLSHYVCIEHLSTKVAVYVDGKLVIANDFGVAISDFTNLIFGVDAFMDAPCVKNLAIFDKIRILGTARYLTSGSDIADTISVPSGKFDISESTLLIYQNGILNIDIEETVAEDSSG